MASRWSLARHLPRHSNPAIGAGGLQFTAAALVAPGAGTGTASVTEKTQAARLESARRAAFADGTGTRVYEPAGGSPPGRGQAPAYAAKPLRRGKPVGTGTAVCGGGLGERGDLLGSAVGRAAVDDDVLEVVAEAVLGGDRAHRVGHGAGAVPADGYERYLHDRKMKMVVGRW